MYEVQFLTLAGYLGAERFKVGSSQEAEHAFRGAPHLAIFGAKLAEIVRIRYVGRS